MDVSKPFAAISPGVELDVLVVLAGSEAARSGREVARRAGRSNTGTQHVLDRLVEHGLVDRGEAGRTFLYALNRAHVLAPAVEKIAAARTELIHRLRDTIGAWAVAPVHASLFGSAARGDGDVRSDIDLLVVRPDHVDVDDATWRSQVDELAESVRHWTGNRAGLVELADADVARLREERPPVAEEVSNDAVDLFGEPTRKLLQRL